MKKITMFLFGLLLVLMPFQVEAKNALKLNNNLTINAGEDAKFTLGIDIDNTVGNNLDKITFEVEVTGGKTDNFYHVVGNVLQTWKVTKTNNNIEIKRFDSSENINSGDNLLEIVIPVKSDSPEGEINVLLKNIVFTVKETPVVTPPTSSDEPSSSEAPEPTYTQIEIDDVARKITVNRKVLSEIASLESLTISIGELNPAFNSSIKEYEVVVKDTINKVTVEAVCKDNCSSINGNTNQTFKKTYTLAKGENDPISVKVISQNTLNSEEYKINFYRGELLEERADLKSLTITGIELDPEFKPNSYNYYIRSPYELESLDIKYELFDNNSEVTIEGNEKLEVGKESKIIIKIVSADTKIEKTYNIYVTREEDTSSSKMIISDGETDKDEKESTPKKSNKLLLIIIIIILALLVIAGSFFFLFKNKKKNGKSKNDKDLDNHGVAISHEDDEELLEYTKEFTEFPNNLNDQIRKDNDYDKL